MSTGYDDTQPRATVLTRGHDKAAHHRLDDQGRRMDRMEAEISGAPGQPGLKGSLERQAERLDRIDKRLVHVEAMLVQLLNIFRIPPWVLPLSGAVLMLIVAVAALAWKMLGSGVVR